MYHTGVSNTKVLNPFYSENIGRVFKLVMYHTGVSNTKVLNHLDSENILKKSYLDRPRHVISNNVTF